MNPYPAKLIKYLDALSPDERRTKALLFERTLDAAQRNGLQSPRFWAMRQVLAGLDARQIEQKMRRRIGGGSVSS